MVLVRPRLQVVQRGRLFDLQVANQGVGGLDQLCRGVRQHVVMPRFRQVLVPGGYLALFTT